MTVLVTGGTGVVGRAVVQRLIDTGRTVRALARSDASAGTLASLGAAPERGDVLDRQALGTAMAGCEVVFHIAGKVEFCSANPAEMMRVNVDGTRTVLEAAEAAGVRRVVHTSSAVTLGERPGEVGAEATHHRGRFLSRYEESKVEAERLALGWTGDVEVVAVNPSSVQGPGRSTGTGRIFLDAVNGRLPAVVDTVFSVVDVDDCAEGHLLAEQRGEPGERYVLSGFTIGVREALGLLGDLTGRPTRVPVIPAWVLRPLGPVADLLGRFVDAVPVCAESLRQMRAGARYDGSRATRDLGLEYRAPRDTFVRMLEWFRAEGLTAS